MSIWPPGSTVPPLELAGAAPAAALVGCQPGRSLVRQSLRPRPGWPRSPRQRRSRFAVAGLVDDLAAELALDQIYAGESVIAGRGIRVAHVEGIAVARVVS